MTAFERQGLQQIPLLTELSPVPSLSFEPVAEQEVIPRLELGDFPPLMHHSVLGSDWYTINEGRMFLEVRNPHVLQKEQGDVVYFVDFDDCIFSATGWHKKEYQLIEEDEELHKRGILISSERAKEIYERSKIIVPGKAENERRYTPEFNLVLLTNYAQRLENGIPPDHAWEQLLTWREAVNSMVQLDGEAALEIMPVDNHFRELFMSNLPKPFVYQDFLEDFFGTLEESDSVIFATRGKIEGPLGQVHKLHSSGVLQYSSREEQYRSKQHPVDLVIYTNDLKAQALLNLTKLVPWVKGKLLRIIDDNPNEIIPYLEAAREHGLTNIEIIQVGHYGAKRRDISTGIEPDLLLVGESEKETNYRHYMAFPDRMIF